MRAHRKECGLTQQDIAALTGSANTNQISLIEQYQTLPKLPLAIALCIILDEKIETLFYTLYQQIEQNIQTNAKTLIRELSKKHPRTARKTRRITILKKLTKLT